MATLNYAFKELSCKIVYYGCGLCGKTTNLIYIHKTVPPKFRGELVSLATEQDRTLFFDFLPLDLGEVKGFKTKFQLYTVPGQVYYNATRKLVLRGVDGLVFVADSQRDRFQENIDSLENLKQNLAEYGYHLQTSSDDMDGIPWVLQYNKRDMPQISSREELDKALNHYNVPVYESVATTGQGVKDVLKGISSLVIKKLNQETTPGAGLAQEKDTRRTPVAVGTGAGTQKPASPTRPSAPPPPKPDDDEYGAINEDELEEKPAAKSQAPTAKVPPVPGKVPPGAGKPAPAPPRPATPQPPAAPPQPAAPALPSLNLQKQNKALWRGMGLGSANLTLANLVGGEPGQYQLTGKVSFLGVFGSTWSRKLRFRGNESRTEEGVSSNYWKFASDDGQQPELELWVKDDYDKSLWATYLGKGGEVHIVPPGKKPLS